MKAELLSYQYQTVAFDGFSNQRGMKLDEVGGA